MIPIKQKTSFLKNAMQVLALLLKYGAYLTVILDVLQYASDKLQNVGVKKDEPKQDDTQPVPNL